MLSTAFALHGLGAMALAAGIALLAASLMLAVLIDFRWGEPRASLHPVVGMGRYLQVCGRVTTRLSAPAAFVLGALAWWVGALAVAAVAWGVQQVALAWVMQLVGQLAGTAPLMPDGAAGAAAHGPWWGLQEAGATALMVLLLAGLLKCMFAWRMLRQEAGAVEAALQQSLAQGRERLSWLVSRDTSQLSPEGVRESAIESLAENLNDSVIAPIFWCLLFGLPGAAVYRFANTADAMWGYRGVYRGTNWEWAGKWAARADDVLSWLPARITAALLVAAAPRAARPRLSQVAVQAALTPSPNSGWPMAAAALALGLSLGKPGVYRLNAQGRAPEAADMARAQSLCARAVSLAVRLGCGLLVVAATGAALAALWS